MGLGRKLDPLGLLTTTAIVLSSGTPKAISRAARILKRFVFHGRIQICDGTTDGTRFNEAINDLPT